MATDLERLALRHGIRPGLAEVVGAAAARLGTTARMLRYRESLGLLAPARTAGGYRTYGEHDLLAAAYAADLEERYGVPPAAVAFALRAVHEAAVQGAAREPGHAAALDFETRKARALLRLAS